jgi:glucose/arabinose dehydrogenase
MKNSTLLLLLLLGATSSCQSQQKKNKTNTPADNVSTTTQEVHLPEPYATKSSIKFSKVTGWKDQERPTAPAGFSVEKFATGLNNPRWIYQAANGDIFVSQATTGKSAIDVVVGRTKAENLGKSANNVLLFRDANHDGVPEIARVFLDDLNKPFGMLVLNGYFYVATTDAVWRYPYQPGDTALRAKGQKILDLPAGGYNNHWTRNLLANADGSKIYVTVGSGSNVAEHGIDNEVRRANILEINPDGSGERIYASGLRNPVGMAWAPGTHTLWTAVNERDELGDELVPDYITSIKEGGFYGWPYAYFGQHKDPRMNNEREDLVAKTIVPDVALGSHTASLGLAFYTGNAFPEKYRNGAFIGQHGSWNRSVLTGYRVAFVPFRNGKASGPAEDFLTGFLIDPNGKEVHGRPVGVTVLQDGSMLVADDAANTIWRIRYGQ